MADRGAPAVCSECGNPLPGVHAKQKTCSQQCRQKRSRRLIREARQRERARETGQADVSQVAKALAQRPKVEDVAHEVLADELRPIIRERITGSVLQQLERMSTLTPTALDRLQKDLDSEDEQIRQRAYTLVLRYTLGNPAAAPPPVEAEQAPVTIQFNLPRPGQTDVPEVVPAEATEVRTCQDCGQTKSAMEFVGSSERCTSCYDAIQDQIRSRFGDEV